jgi:Spy/CpxP family protein refolding chaperone
MNPSRIFQRLHAMAVLMTTSNAPVSTAATFVAATAWRRVSKEFYRMKKVLICALLAIAMACLGTALYAQDSMSQGQGMGQGGPGGMHHMPMSPDQRLQRMTQQLNLTADQQQKIKPILEQEQQQMQTLHGDTSMSQQDRMSKMQQIRQGTNDQIKSVLNPDQQQKFTQMQERHGPGMGHGGMGQDGMQAPPQQTPPQQ